MSHWSNCKLGLHSLSPSLAIPPHQLTSNARKLCGLCIHPGNTNFASFTKLRGPRGVSWLLDFVIVPSKLVAWDPFIYECPGVDGKRHCCCYVHCHICEVRYSSISNYTLAAIARMQLLSLALPGSLYFLISKACTKHKTPGFLEAAHRNCWHILRGTFRWRKTSESTPDCG